MISWLGLTVFLLLFDLFMWAERGKVSVCSWREFRLCLREITCCSAALNSGRFPPLFTFSFNPIFVLSVDLFFRSAKNYPNLKNLDRIEKQSIQIKKKLALNLLDPISKKNRIGICSIQFLKNKIGSELTRSNFQKIKSALTLLNPIF